MRNSGIVVQHSSVTQKHIQIKIMFKRNILKKFFMVTFLFSFLLFLLFIIVQELFVKTNKLLVTIN